MNNTIVNNCAQEAVYYQAVYQELTATYLVWFAILGFFTACVMFLLIWIINYARNSE